MDWRETIFSVLMQLFESFCALVVVVIALRKRQHECQRKKNFRLRSTVCGGADTMLETSTTGLVCGNVLVSSRDGLVPKKMEGGSMDGTSNNKQKISRCCPGHTSDATSFFLFCPVFSAPVMIIHVVEDIKLQSMTYTSSARNQSETGVSVLDHLPTSTDRSRRIALSSNHFDLMRL